MIFSENRFPLFGIMRSARTLTPGDAGQALSRASPPSDKGSTRLRQGAESRPDGSGWHHL